MTISCVEKNLKTRVLVKLFLVCATLSLAADRDDTIFSVKAEKAAKELRNRIRAESNALTNHPWAGEYCRTSESLILAPGAGYLFELHGCCGLYHRNYGSITETNGIIRLSFTFSNEWAGTRAIAEEYVPVSWGERCYLIPPDDIVDFCNEVNDAYLEPRRDALGFFLMRDGDGKKVVWGLPSVPETYRPYLLTNPITARIIGIGSAASVITNANRSAWNTTLTLDAGRARGLLKSMTMRVVERPWVSVQVTKVDDRASEAVMTQFDENREKLKKGWQLSTQWPGADKMHTTTWLAGPLTYPPEVARFTPAEREVARLKALVSLVAIHGTNSPDYAETLDALAAAYCGEGRYAEAEPLFAQASAILRPFVTNTTVGLGLLRLETVSIPSGTFVMGDNQCSCDSEQPAHEVRIGYEFRMGKYEVTRRQYKQFMAETGIGDWDAAHMPADDKAMKHVSWHAAKAFCHWMTMRDWKAGVLPRGYEWRLPTEAEWEYACRSGGTGKWCFGDDASQLEDYAWMRENSCTAVTNHLTKGNGETLEIDVNGNGETHQVGQKKPNRFGLYDMHGNVREWCEDKLHENYQGAPTNGIAWQSTDPTAARIMRGGAWLDSGDDVRSSHRSSGSPDFGDDYIGFRVVAAPSL